MTTINYTAEYNVPAGSVKVEWASLAENDDGEPFDSAGLRIASAHVWGTFNGGTLTVQGSNRVSPGNFQELFVNGGPTYYQPSDDAKPDFAGAVRPIVSGGSGNSIGVALVLVAA